MPLYLVFTPIGNLEDITLRALRVLQEADLIAAEDTRHTGKLLVHYDIQRPLISLHEHNEAVRIPGLLARLNTGESVVLVSDAGAPAIADPGYQLIRAAIQAGHQPIPIPGPSALLAALVASGLPTDRFLFLGFPPRKAKARTEWLSGLRNEPGVLIFYESPRRLPSLLSDIVQTLGADRRVVIARELTKLHEQFWRGRAEEAVRAFAEPPRGEIVVLVAGARKEAGDQGFSPEVEEVLAGLLAGGMGVSRAARLLAEITGLPRRQLYQRALDLAGSSSSP
ncbi:MAG TPA: 16S rRNA (cytidine(1402)-2'-O)-methyltransferase [Anaerolineae bacterium]|nr:16S rRNA (cytidine(1402)-2'-O)-methyltransferase [Anaerolineae bacterium]